MAVSRQRILAGGLIGLTAGAVTGLIGGLLAIPLLGIPDTALGTTYGHELLTRWIPATAAAGLIGGGMIAARGRAQ